ncbi:carbohydrate binding domain-containing protein [Spirochaeta isovalerica]|uniref:Beta-glucanase (GH16 family) n=1 Tax=Spirochaeta isovalerica TaxID=150 RepID=A0A841R8D3_9SPIO|nr:carbohydrate binding domain-containing protein [Spirochaeta isovalerica]MBB6479290.1 beta-glucanase (GH16 family) [Spirochaeta isovalerica]
MKNINPFKIAFIIPLILISCAGTGEKTAGEVEAEKDWILVWEDDFDDEIISDGKWNFIEGAGGYGNNELQYYSPRNENARIEKGNLVIEAREESYKGSPYTSAKLTTEGKGEWTYGRFDFKARLPEGQGIWPAIWMMPADMEVYGGWPSCGEIDIMELVGHEPSTVHGTLHYGMPWKYTGSPYTLEKGKFSDDFHIFSLVWLPGEIKWYVDGKLVQTQDDWYSQKNSREEAFAFNAPFDRDLYLQLNVAVGGNWPGYPDETTVFPQRMEIDWVRVYEAADGYGKPPVKKPVEEAEITGRDPLDDGNYVFNSTFDDQMKWWEFGNYEGGMGNAAVENGEMHIAISGAGGQIWANQLIQLDMFLQEGQTYKVSFDARAAAPRDIMVKMGGLGDRGWAAYSGEQYISIGTDMKAYSFEFTMEEKSDAHARYEFNMGLHTADLWIDNPRLELVGDPGVKKDYMARTPLDSGNYIYNGTFDQGYDRKAFWKLDYDGNSDAWLSVSPEIYTREGHLSILDSSGDMNGIRLYQEGFSFEAGEKWHLSFDAYARGNRKLYAAFLDKQGTIAAEPQAVDLSTVKRHYTMDFTVDAPIENGKAAFLPAVSGGATNPDIILDNIMLWKD